MAAFVIFVFSLLAYFFWMTLAQRLSAVYRREYFRAIMSQEMAWFDEVNPQEIATKLSHKATLIASATGEKTGLLIMGVMTLISGQIIGLYYGWQLTMIMIAFGPLLIFAVLLMTKCAIKFFVGAHMSYIKAGALVEQALGSIRTVLAFGNVRYEMNRYSAILHDTLKLNQKLGLLFGFGMGIFLFIMYFDYALGFLIGAIFV